MKSNKKNSTAYFGSNTKGLQAKAEKQDRVQDLVASAHADLALLEQKNRLECLTAMADKLHHPLAKMSEETLLAFFVDMEVPSSAADRKKIAMNPMRPQEVDALVAEADAEAKARAAAMAEEKKAADNLKLSEKIERAKAALAELERAEAEVKAAEKAAAKEAAAAQSEAKHSDKPTA